MTMLLFKPAKVKLSLIATLGNSQMSFHQQLDKSSEGPRKSECLYQKHKADVLKKLRDCQSEHLISEVFRKFQTFRSSDTQINRPPDFLRLSDHQSVTVDHQAEELIFLKNHSQTVRHSEQQTIRYSGKEVGNISQYIASPFMSSQCQTVVLYQDKQQIQTILSLTVYRSHFYHCWIAKLAREELVAYGCSALIEYSWLCSLWHPR